jgi:hypothetical protein
VHVISKASVKLAYDDMALTFFFPVLLALLKYLVDGYIDLCDL